MRGIFWSSALALALLPGAGSSATPAVVPAEVVIAFASESSDSVLRSVLSDGAPLLRALLDDSASSAHDGGGAALPLRADITLCADDGASATHTDPELRRRSRGERELHCSPHGERMLLNHYTTLGRPVTLLALASGESHAPAVLERLLALGANASAATEGARVTCLHRVAGGLAPVAFGAAVQLQQQQQQQAAQLRRQQAEQQLDLEQLARAGGGQAAAAAAQIQAAVAAAALLAQQLEQQRWRLRKMELLLAHGADPHAQSAPVTGGATPLTLCAMANATQAALMLLLHARAAPPRDTAKASSGGDGGGGAGGGGGAVAVLDRRDAHGATALFYAALNCNVPLLRALLQRGASPGLPNVRGNTPLGEAAQARCAACTAALLAAGASPRVHNADKNSGSMEGATPLHDAVAEGCGKGTPAHQQQLRLVALLLDAGADASARTRVGDTPLDMAVCEAAEAKRLLAVAMAARAQVNARRPRGGWGSLRTAETKAAFEAAAALVALLEARGARRGDAARVRRPRAEHEALLQHGVNLSEEGFSGPVDACTTWGGPEVLEIGGKLPEQLGRGATQARDEAARDDAAEDSGGAERDDERDDEHDDEHDDL